MCTPTQWYSQDHIMATQTLFQWNCFKMAHNLSKANNYLINSHITPATTSLYYTKAAFQESFQHWIIPGHSNINQKPKAQEKVQEIKQKSSLSWWTNFIWVTLQTWPNLETQKIIPKLLCQLQSPQRNLQWLRNQELKWSLEMPSVRVVGRVKRITSLWLRK